MTTTEIEELVKLEAAATPGPWVWEEPRPYPATELLALKGAGGKPVCCFGDIETYYPSAGVEPEEPDKLLIVAARNALPKLLVRITELETLARKACDDIDRCNLYGAADRARQSIANLAAALAAPTDPKGP